MIIEKIKVINYKIFKEKIIPLNNEMNIFVGENDSGKSTILEIVNIITTGKLNNINLDRQINSNMFNNLSKKEYINSIIDKNYIEPPNIIIEAYCKKDNQYSEFKGTNNSLGEDCPGISFNLQFNSEYSKIYKEKLLKEEIFDIPLEFYELKFISFKGETIISKYLPFKTALIDTSKKDYSNLVNRFISDNITQYLSGDDKISLRSEYRKNHANFKNTTTVKELNKKIEENVKINDKKININIKENGIDSWKDEMEISVEDIPFDNIGFGTQNTIKIELALKNDKDSVNTIIIEEPENNLSYGNMSKLISKIQENSEKQVFIASHSSFVANKLGIKNIILVHNGNINTLKALDDDTMNYFKKLPGYDTLRVILANKVILVEGPADDLIIQRAYLDNYQKLPIEDGIDVIAVNALSFKRYCDIALLIGKKITIVTDNDGNIQKNINEKYEEYINYPNIKICYEKNEKLNTLEPSVISSNIEDEVLSENFKKSISSKDSMLNKTNEQIKYFMSKNKTEWSMRVFDYKEKIKYPQYILDAIEK